ncbi:hypothetical protein N9J18_02150 [Porticoccaceae bacterium]|nr:hypothetical protein [Porticoccaceae bacterium]
MTAIGVEVYKVKGSDAGGDPVVLGWYLPTTSTRYSGYREAGINFVAQGNRSTSFNFPYSINTFGRRQDSYNSLGTSTYNRITVYGAPFFPDTWDGGTTASANNANIPLSGLVQWGDFVGADNKGQRLGSSLNRIINNPMMRERSLPWKMAVRTDGNITGYNSGGTSIDDNGTARSLSNSKLWEDYANTSDSRVRSAPITDSPDGRHYQTGTYANTPFDTVQQTKNHSQVLSVYYDAGDDIFRIVVAGNWNTNSQAVGGARLQIAGLFLVEGYAYGGTAAPYTNSITTKFYLEDATLTYSTSTNWYSKGTDIRANPYPDDDITIITWSNITSNPFDDTVTNTGHAESTSTIQWNGIVYPIKF